MKNYYEILEVNKKASKEVIEKAYKVLVKKYHPDLNHKVSVNKKIQDINEAYEVLSNDFLREQYDTEYEKKYNRAKQYDAENYTTNSSREMYKKVNINENFQNSEQVKKKKNNVGTIDGIIDIVKEIYKSRPSKEELREITSNNILALVLTVIVIIVLGIILWFIPFTNGWMRELLFENPIFNWIGHFFSK